MGASRVKFVIEFRENFVRECVEKCSEYNKVLHTFKYFFPEAVNRYVD